MTKIIDRTGKGTALSAADNDANASSLAGINEAQTVSPYTITIDDQNRTIEISSVGAFTANLTAIATIAAALHTDDFKVRLKNIGAGTATLTRGSTDVFDDASTSITLVTGDTIEIQTDSTLARWNVLSPIKILGITNGTVQASRAVVVDGNKDAIGFGKITGSTASGYTASFTYTGTTNYDRALVASVTMGAGITYALSSESQSTTGGAAAVYSIAYGATGAVSSGYFESRSNAGFAVNAVTTVAGGTPVFARAFDAIDVNPVADLRKGSSRFLFNPKTSAGSYNSIVQSGDQLITSVGADGLANSSAITIAPYASDAVGIRADSTTDNVTITGTTITLTGSVNGTTNLTGTFQLGGVAVTSSAAELNYNDITTLGTAQASKVLTLDASSNLNGTVASANITTASVSKLALAVASGATIIKRILGSTPINADATAFADANIYHDAYASGALATLYIGTAVATGQIRVNFTTNAVTSTLHWRIVANGTAVITGSNAAAGIVSSSQTINVVRGDIVTMQFYFVTAGTHTVYDVNVSASTDTVGIV